MLTVNLDKARKDLGNTAAGRTDYRVFTCLTEYMNSEGVAAIPQSAISKETGFKRRTTSNSVKRLEEKGFLTIERNMTEHGGIATNIYHINRKYLTETQTVTDKRASQCSACNKPCCPETNDARRFSHDMTRLHDVLVDVVADILEAAAERNSK